MAGNFFDYGQLPRHRRGIRCSPARSHLDSTLARSVILGHRKATVQLVVDRGLDLLREFAAVLIRILKAAARAAVIGLSVDKPACTERDRHLHRQALHLEIGFLLRSLCFHRPGSEYVADLARGMEYCEAALCGCSARSTCPQDASLAISRLLEDRHTTAAGLAGGVCGSRAAPRLHPESSHNSGRRQRCRSRQSSGQPYLLFPWSHPWLTRLISAMEKSELYHAIDQANYISRSSPLHRISIPIVRQYRPALERFTYESAGVGHVDSSGELQRNLCPTREESPSPRPPDHSVACTRQARCGFREAGSCSNTFVSGGDSRRLKRSPPLSRESSELVSSNACARSCSAPGNSTLQLHVRPWG